MSNTVLITGASGGIGKELATVFASHGHDLILTARNRHRLDALCKALHMRYGIRATAIPADLSEDGSAERLVRDIEHRGLQVDVLVNNAGFGDHCLFAESDSGKQEAMIRLNVLALTSLTRAVLPAMMRRRRGRVLNVASIASFLPGPYMAVYYATKAYVLSLSQALAAELKPYGITVTALCPGLVDTGFEKTADLEKTALFKTLPVSDPAAVAKYGYCITMCGKSVGVHGIPYKAMAFASRLAPRDLLARIILSIQSGRRSISISKRSDYHE